MAQEIPHRGKSDYYRKGDDDDDEEEEVDETGYKAVKDAVLFAIEVSDSMLKRPNISTDEKNAKLGSNSPLSAALKCAYHLMQQRIISQPKDLIGILLYGTEKTRFTGEEDSTKGGWSYPNCYLLTELDVPEAEDVKRLRGLVEDDSTEALDIFKASEQPVSMHTVLFCANQIFQQQAPNFTSRRLFIVTDNDDPHAQNKAFRSQATVRAKDLYDLGVVIELFPISTPEHAFDTKLFYDDIVYKSSPTDPDAVLYNPPSLTDIDKSQIKTGSTDGLDLLQSLISSVSSRATPKRALFSSLPLEFGPDLKISVKGYLLYKHQKPARSCYVYLGSDKPQIAMYSSDISIGAAAEKVEKAEVRKAFTFGGEQILFTPDELKQLRDFGDPVLRILGFKPLDKLPMWANIKSSTFIYPSEEDYIGSTRVYSALYQKMVKDQLMALTWFIARRNATPVVAALIPTLPTQDGDGRPNLAGISATGCPQGLHLIPLPFADDLRQNPPSTYDQPLRAPDELVDAMRPIVQQLNLPKGIFDPNKYPNPSLQWHYKILQALALDEDVPTQPEDKTLPKFRQIDKRVGNEAVEWGQILEKAYKEHLMDSPEAAHVGAKRPTASGRGDKATAQGEDEDRADVKKFKAEPGAASNGVNEQQIRQLMEKNKLNSLTVPQLKDFCLSKRLSTAGRKAELVDRVEGWFERK